MKRRNKAIIAISSIVAIIIGLRVWISYTPVHLDGAVSESIDKCATHQKRLYQTIQYYVHENDRLPENLDEFKIKGFPATMYWRCSATERGYNVFLENYGDPQKVVISDQVNKHPTTFKLWFRGYQARVQTMGDGTIHLYKGGKLMTMVGARSKPFLPKPPPTLLDQNLPDLSSLGIDLPPNALEGKKLMICFFDVTQRPSRHCITQLANQTDSLKDKGIVCIAVQVSQVDPELLKQWIPTRTPFVVEPTNGIPDKTRFDWGVPALPWLIQTDNNHKIVSEGSSEVLSSD